MNASKFRVVRTRVLSLLGSSYGFILSCFRCPCGLIAGPEPHPPPTHSPDGLQVARHCKERAWKNVFPFHFIYSETVVLACSALPLPPSLPPPPSLGHRGDIQSSPIYYSLDYLSGGSIDGHVIVIVMRTLAGTMLHTGYGKPC